jgi:hypothetical protein
VKHGQNAGFAELKVMMQQLTSHMKTLLDYVAKLDQTIQTLEKRQPKSTISKSTMMGLLPELAKYSGEIKKFRDSHERLQLQVQPFIYIGPAIDEVSTFVTVLDDLRFSTNSFLMVSLQSCLARCKYHARRYENFSKKDEG